MPTAPALTNLISVPPTRSSSTDRSIAAGAPESAGGDAFVDALHAAAIRRERAGSQPDETAAPAGTDASTAAVPDAMAVLALSGLVLTVQRSVPAGETVDPALRGAAADDSGRITATATGLVDVGAAGTGKEGSTPADAAAGLRTFGAELVATEASAAAATEARAATDVDAEAIAQLARRDPAARARAARTNDAGDAAASPMADGTGAAQRPAVAAAIAPAPAVVPPQAAPAAPTASTSEDETTSRAPRAAAAQVAPATPPVASNAEALRASPAPASETSKSVAPAETAGVASFGAPTGAAPRQEAPQIAIPTAVGAPGWSEEVASNVAQVVARGHDRAELRLNPAELGPVGVRIELRGGEATLSFVAPSAATRDALEQALPDLRDQLASQGITLGDTSVRDGGGQRFEAPREPAPPLRTTATAGSSGAAPNAEAPARTRRDGLVDTFA
jgi:flagellar hook-length control protein FliK